MQEDTDVFAAFNFFSEFRLTYNLSVTNLQNAQLVNSWKQMNH